MTSTRSVELRDAIWDNLDDLSFHFNMNENDTLELAIKTLAFLAVKMNEGIPFFMQTEPGVVVPLELPTKKRDMHEQ